MPVLKNPYLHKVIMNPHFSFWKRLRRNIEIPRLKVTLILPFATLLHGLMDVRVPKTISVACISYDLTQLHRGLLFKCLSYNSSLDVD